MARQRVTNSLPRPACCPYARVRAQQGLSRDGFGRIVMGDVLVGINGKPIKREADLFGECARRCWRRGPGGQRLAAVVMLWWGDHILHAFALRMHADVLDQCKVGQTVQVEVLRGGERRTLAVTLAERQTKLME